MAQLRVVVLGQMGRSPFAGQSWLYVNWLQSLRKLGHDVWYVEDDGSWPYNPVADTLTDDCPYAVGHIARCLEPIGMRDRWCYRFAMRADKCWGATERELADLYRTSDVLLNVCGSTVLRDEHLVSPFRVFIETDPVGAQLRIANGDAQMEAIHAAHDAFATYGENFGNADCYVPLNGVEYVKTRQPIDLESWPAVFTPDALVFTTVGNYRQQGKDIDYADDTYRWSKHHEWERFIDLPGRCDPRFELALAIDDDDKIQLEEHGWNVVPALPMSLDVFGAYPEFIRASRAEFTVAKDQNVRLRSGWFSERDACYLASGKPVVAQDTAFGVALPTGEGLFAFATADEAIAAIDEINGDYQRHAKAARAIAEEYLDGRIVASALLAGLGLT
jgi:hypothetical protein